MPRILRFFTTLAFLARAATNEDNDFRVHVAPGSVCYGCHVSLDPMRNYFANSFTAQFRSLATMGTGETSFGFRDVTKDGGDLFTFADTLSKHPDFPMGWTQRMCYWANSQACDETDPEFLRVKDAFVASNFKWKTLIRELFSSPLVTGAAETQTQKRLNGTMVSINRRSHLCADIANLLNSPTLCTSNPLLASFAATIPDDEYGRGSAEPMQPTELSLLNSGGLAAFCNRLASLIVDAASSSLNPAKVDASLDTLVSQIMAVPSGDSRFTPIRKILQDHVTAAGAAKASATEWPWPQEQQPLLWRSLATGLPLSWTLGDRNAAFAAQGPEQFCEIRDGHWRRVVAFVVCQRGGHEATNSADRANQNDLGLINAELKKSGTPAQKEFLDRHALSNTQLKDVRDRLGQALESAGANWTNDAPGQLKAAIAMIQLKLSPVIVVSIPFGSDNHADVGLAKEAATAVAGVAAINTFMTDLKTAGLQDKVTFATFNTFGRTMALASSQNGRNHNQNHHTSVMIGKGIKGSVIGGLVEMGKDYGAEGFDSATGAPNPSGDVKATESLESMSKTLGTALGISSSALDLRIKGGKPVPAALV